VLPFASYAHDIFHQCLQQNFPIEKRTFYLNQNNISRFRPTNEKHSRTLATCLIFSPAPHNANLYSAWHHWKALSLS